MPKFQEIPQRIGFGNYRANQSWRYLRQWLKEQEEFSNLDLDPDFQRGHVWSRNQQIAYVEFILSGGNTAKQLLFNSPSWMHGQHNKSHLVLVDGKQRLNAVLLFLDDEFCIWSCVV